ncbi:MAG: ParB N-terminal domain-containing protein [Candidatus Thermoplasmatota archaeon]|nr:ParB N-terminal domain-containing protein [Candidatus Thermoplasmatota archaeon]
MKYKFVLLEIDKIREHEETYPERAKALAEEIKKDGTLKIPMLVDDRYYILLDGHHRFQALKILGCRRIPAFLVDYFDDGISVGVWEDAIARGKTSITKEEIIEIALKGKKFQPKTSRHFWEAKPKPIEVKLEELI